MDKRIKFEDFGHLYTVEMMNEIIARDLQAERDYLQACADAEIAAAEKAEANSARDD